VEPRLKLIYVGEKSKWNRAQVCNLLKINVYSDLNATSHEIESKWTDAMYCRL